MLLKKKLTGENICGDEGKHIYELKYMSPEKILKTFFEEVYAISSLWLQACVEPFLLMNNIQ